MHTETLLSRREVALRSAAAASLAGIALVQAVGLPSLLVQERSLAVLSMASMALCVGLGMVLAAAPASASPQLWRGVAAIAVLVLAAWAGPRAFAVPGLDRSQGRWTAMPGAGCGVLAAACLALAVVAARPRRPALRGLATAAALLIAVGPGVGALLVAIGPVPVGGEAALAAGEHVHAQSSFESGIRFRPGSGRHGSHYVVPVTVPPHETAMGLAPVVASALLFAYGTVGHLRRRSAPAAAA